jgi:hypothetical protein
MNDHLNINKAKVVTISLFVLAIFSVANQALAASNSSSNDISPGQRMLEILGANGKLAACQKNPEGPFCTHLLHLVPPPEITQPSFQLPFLPYLIKHHPNTQTTTTASTTLDTTTPDTLPDATLTPDSLMVTPKDQDATTTITVSEFPDTTATSGPDSIDLQPSSSAGLLPSSSDTTTPATQDTSTPLQ